MIFHRRQMRWEEGSHTHMARWMHVNAHRKKHRVWPSASSIIRASRAHPLSLRQLVEVGGRTGKEAVIRVGRGRARIGGPQRMVSGWTKKKCRGKYRRIILCWDVDKKKHTRSWTTTTKDRGSSTLFSTSFPSNFREIEKRLQALRKVEKNRIWVAKTYNKKVKLMSFQVGDFCCMSRRIANIYSSFNIGLTLFTCS
jgi:hypothetical protein